MILMSSLKILFSHYFANLLFFMLTYCNIILYYDYIILNIFFVKGVKNGFHFS